LSLDELQAAAAAATLTNAKKQIVAVRMGSAS